MVNGLFFLTFGQFYYRHVTFRLFECLLYVFNVFTMGRIVNIAALFIMSFCSAFGQNLTQTIKGTITDQQSGQPLVGVVVAVVDVVPPKGAVTDNNGFFKITEVPIGRHQIKVSYYGYEERNFNDILFSSGKEVILNIQMQETLLEVDEIVLDLETKPRGEANNDMATVSATSLTAEQTKRIAASFEDPGRAVASFPGVVSNNDESNEIVVRGNSPRGVLWRIEGIEIPNPNHFADDGASGGAISVLSTNVMDNSDFFTGAFPAEYGNATSGVFDIGLRSGNAGKKEYGLQMGILGMAATMEGPFIKDKGSTYLINYRYSTLAFFDNIGIELLGGQEDLLFQDLSAKFYIPTKKIGTFSLWGVGGANSFKYKGDGLVLEGTDTLYNDFWTENWKTRMFATGLTHKVFLGENTYLKSTLAFTGTTNKFKLDSISITDIGKEDITNTAVRASFLMNQKLDKQNTLRSGLILSQLNFNLYSAFADYTDSTGFGAFQTELDEKGGSQLVQVYSQWQWRVNPKLTMNTGLHMMHFVLNGNTSLEPRWGANWSFAKNQSLNAGIGKHSRLETMSIYHARYELPDGSGVTPNQKLDFTKALHFVLGYSNQISKNLKFKTEAYYQHLYDVPVRPSESGDEWDNTFSALNAVEGWTTDTLVNEGTGKNYGIEFTVERFFADGYYFLTTGSLFNSKYQNADGQEWNTRFNGNWVFNVMGGKEWAIGREKNNLLSLNMRLISAGGKRTIPINLEQSISQDKTIREWDNAYTRKLPSYFRFDLGMQYRRNKPKHSSIWSLNIQNVTARQNVAGEYFDNNVGAIRTYTQLGILPIFSYRVEF